MQQQRGPMDPSQDSVFPVEVERMPQSQQLPVSPQETASDRLARLKPAIGEVARLVESDPAQSYNILRKFPSADRAFILRCISPFPADRAPILRQFPLKECIDVLEFFDTVDCVHILRALNNINGINDVADIMVNLRMEKSKRVFFIYLKTYRPVFYVY